MKEQQFAESIVFDNSQNQFMAQYLQYEACPFCNRKFFRGKLSLHLKLCNNDSPMLKSIKPKKSHPKNSQSTFDTNYQRCNICNTKIPKFLMERHCKNCSGEHNITNQIKEIQIKQVKRKGNEVNLPRIQNSARENMERKANITTEIKKPQSSVKIRQQLRCFKKAEQVQKVICDNCGRKFSEKAALRHIPICQKLKKKQSFEISLQKQSKSLFTKTKLKSKEKQRQKQKGEKSKESTSFFENVTTPVRQLLQEEIKQADFQQSIQQSAKEQLERQRSRQNYNQN